MYIKKSHYKILVFLLFVGFSSFGQNQWTMGLNYGITYANISANQTTEDTKGTFNYVLGGTINYHFNDVFLLRTDVLFERKSFKKKIDASEAIDPRVEGKDFETILSYITLPILAEYKFGTRNNFFIHGGPYVSLLVGNKASIEGNTVSAEYEGSYNATDYGLTLGVGTIFELSSYNWLLLELRHNRGMSDINKTDVIDNGPVNINAFNLLITWELRL